MKKHLTNAGYRERNHALSLSIPIGVQEGSKV
jgi:hypothetical protein